ncbi:amidase signature domain-containing protein [Aspergillus pseudonomiae]|uniref:Amidase signature domain-containing protein n=1 Tax=Aspergillus pseudonomiae TaxID=1506151 RepID=A0A5N6I447_9EURO|nr:amidase signature domain-containing protein [Aspergillus pseudonomiae]KAB8261481.1 amidase signature domain-containing protein [Aspergillus pseudonomiae]KAE8400334.1 amidase signature domain-containing protein [Aspergillus pseudonomiae]
MEPIKEMPSWEEIFQGMQATRDSSLARIPRQLLSPSRLSITETPAENLVVSLAAGELTATAVTNVLLRRAAITQKVTIYIYEVLPERAILEGKQLDNCLVEHGKPIGPLHGFPINNTAGFVVWVGHKNREDAKIVKIFVDASVVLYARKTEPLGLSALQALYGSPHGIGSDIGLLSPTVGGIKLFMRSILVAKPRTIARALQETVERLKALSSDVEVIEWKPYQKREGSESLTRLYTPDGGKAFAKNLALSGGSCLPLLACTLRDTHGAEELIVHGVWEWTLKREMFRYSYFQEWNSVAPEMDVILCPPYSTPAPLLDTSAVHIHLGFVAPVCLHLVAKILKDEKVVQVLEVVKEKIGLPFVDCLA